MRFRFLFMLVATLSVAATYWYTTTASICPAPLAYRLGTLDAEFNLSSEAAKAQMAKAELLWEEAAGRELFVYDENAKFVVDFVFDERQEFADAEASETQALDVLRKKNEEISASVDTLQNEYNVLRENYETKVSAYEARLREYNQTVSNYNDRGGAPADEYQALQAEQQALDREVKELGNTSDQLNKLATEINTLGQQGNEMVAAYNREVAVYNQKYGFSREFTQGDYQGDKINIYKFSSERELESVLAHEFGHALGLNHVEGDSSIMYYLLVDTAGPLQLSADDKQALIEVCGEEDNLAASIRRYIRKVLVVFN